MEDMHDLLKVSLEACEALRLLISEFYKSMNTEIKKVKKVRNKIL